MRSGFEQHSCKHQSAQEEIFIPLITVQIIMNLKTLIESLKVVNSYGGWTSINYFVFPGHDRQCGRI